MCLPAMQIVLKLLNHSDCQIDVWNCSCQNCRIYLDRYVVNPPYVRPHFSYLSILVLGSWCWMVKYWHWRYILFDRLLCCLLIFYEYNLYCYKLLVVLKNYWSLWVTSIKLLSHCKVIFTFTSEKKMLADLVELNLAQANCSINGFQS